jgi:galactokinase
MREQPPVSIQTLYADVPAAVARYGALGQRLSEKCPGGEIRFFSAPGRSELGGNHTDHQHGHVLAASVDLDMAAAAALNGTDSICIYSEGFDEILVDVNVLTPQTGEENTSAALVRGIAASFADLGCKVKGFTACMDSHVPKGSGLSSSAAFEVLMGTMMNALFYGGQATRVQIAQIGQRAENVYFGKPCGLMDQMASSWGGVIGIDFADPAQPVVSPVAFDLDGAGYALCIIDSGADHADLTDEYAAIPGELGQVSQFFGTQTVLGIDPTELVERLSALRTAVGDRAVLRTVHELRENVRAMRQVKALSDGDVAAFLHLVRESGQNSWMYLQNVTPAGEVRHQSVGVALALCDLLLGEKGAFRVHGGGFAGTVQALVPLSQAEAFCRSVEGVLGENSCWRLSIRSVGGAEVLV